MKSEENVNIADEKSSSPAYEKDVNEETGNGEIVTVETTHRGLKARHAQIIALGGTIGTDPA